MLSNIVQRLDEFLDKQFIAGKPILLGFSGGPDSSALLHGFWKLKKKYSFDLIVIHVDHGWREESALEAIKLKEYVEGLGFPFVLETLKGASQGSNLEEEARCARLSIFQHYFSENNAQAVVVAHQAQDQAETVLKRLFEGSHFMALGAMKMISKIEKLILWRPFLEISKEELIEYCKTNKINYLVDRTNLDPKFLRARMRKELVPLLESHFGKGIQRNLARLSQTAHEIADYFSSKLEPLSIKDQMDLTEIHPFEAKLALRFLAEKYSLKLGQQHINQILKLLEMKDGQTRRFAFGEKTFIICNGVVNLH